VFTNYFKIAFRYLMKTKVYSFINIAGLSLGLACAMLIMLYTKDELSFDRFHENLNSLYVVTIDVKNPDGSSQDILGITGILHGPRFKANVPEIESYSRIARNFKDIKLGDDIYSQAVMMADTNFFSLFTFSLLKGNATTALQHPSSVVLSQDIAIKHFGSEDVLDKTILIESEGAFKPYTVTGVAKRCPQNSSIQFDVLLPIAIPIQLEQADDNWVQLMLTTFVKLSNGSDVQAVASKMQNVFEDESKEVMEKVHASGFTQKFYHGLLPFSEAHLNQFVIIEAGLTNGSNPLYSYILSGIALFILIIACINFVNLTIAKSVRRAREIGIRKVIGSGRGQLIAQFLGESFLLCGFAFVGAMLLAQILLPGFNHLINKSLSLSYLFDVELVAGYIALFLVTGLLAGFYPALVLSGYNPVQTLYDKFRLTGKNYLQKSLVVFQFVLATIMIMGTITIYKQFDYLTHKDLGYDQENMVRVSKKGVTPREAKLFREELMKNSNIVSVAMHGRGTQNAKLNGDSIKHFDQELIDENFVDILKLQVVQGRNFSSVFPSDSAKAVLINEAFAKMAGWKDPIGREINFFLTGEKKMVVGVVKDYHYAPLKNAIGPLLFAASPYEHALYKELFIRIKPNSESSALPHIENAFKKIFPMHPYVYQFEADLNRKNYEAEAKWKNVILFAALLTIFISAIGLFGLSILTAEKRFKEIGIRKVMGASVRTVVLTLSKDFLLLILFALTLAMPLAYFAGSSWLQSYPYRIEVGMEMFVMTGALVTIVALATISYQSIKAALMNPVEALKRE
jgi:putative ABC transport system permease protein